MRALIVNGGLATALALVVMASAGQADASCSGRKTTGTILGGVGGALLGNSVSHGGGGAVVGGLGGAVVGHEIGRGGCDRPTAAYRAPVRTRAPVHHHSVRRAETAYYDEHGRRIYR